MQLHERAVTRLVEAQAHGVDDPLLLAVRYRQDDPVDVHLLEVLGGFPGGDEDPPFTTVFEPSVNLRMFGKLHLTMCSPAQLRAALRRGDAIVVEIVRGLLVHRSSEGEALAKELQLT